MRSRFDDLQILLTAIRKKLDRYLVGAHKISLNPARKLSIAARLATQTVGALRFFLHNEPGVSSGEDYLRCCGALQSAIVLQDCISVIEQHLGQDSQRSTPAYRTIRNVRNWTVGHPTDKKLKGYRGLCLVELDGEDSFKLCLKCFIFKDDDDNNFPETLEVNIKDLLNNYATIAQTVLQRFESSLTTELAGLVS